MSIHPKYTCNSCTKTYVHKYNYDRHVVCCEFFQKTTSHRQHDAEYIESPPDIHVLYQLMKELAVRVTKVEKENIQLKQQLMKRSKINIVDWLNKLHIDNQPKQSLTEWFKQSVLPNVHLHLDSVYTHDLVSGIVATWILALSKVDGESPIKAYETRSNTFYVYEQTESGPPTWSVFTSILFDKHINHICTQFLIDFKNYWYDKNKDKINEDEQLTNTYVNYYQKILGGPRSTTEYICQKVRQQLYTSTKKAFTQAVEIEFT